MTGKTALKLIERRLNLLGYETYLFWDDIDIISKDLERLEKLEETIKILKKSFTYDFTISSVPNTITQMYFKPGCIECISFGVKKEEEFELLKEVLKNE